MAFEWSRVFSRADINSQRASIYPLGPDLSYDKSIRDVMHQTGASSGEILFSPLNFRKVDIPSSTDTCKLSMATLMHYGKLATRVKAKFD